MVVLTNCRPQTQNISKINFKASACFGTCPVFEMNINGNGEAIYHAGQFNPTQGLFETIIKKSQLDSQIELIEKSLFFNLESIYSTDETDQPTYSLTVNLTNGQTKTIEDYGPAGPENLKSVYRLIFSLRESQHWRQTAHNMGLGESLHPIGLAVK
jgi:hypothetical protein